MLNSTDFVELSELQDVVLLRLKLDQGKGGLDLRLKGVAGKTASGAKGDYRLAVFDTLLHEPRTMVLFAMLAWVFSVSSGAYRLYRGVTKGR